MRMFGALISLDEAKRRVIDCVVPITRTECVPVPDAMDRVIAEDIVASLNVPPFDRSAMDGYAVKASDTYRAAEFKPIGLALAGKIFAGERTNLKLNRGEAIKIATGARIPKGADAVVMAENTEQDKKRVQIFKPVHPKANISMAGEDIKSGTRVLACGMCLDPGKVGVLSALGMKNVKVFAKPDVAIVPTGEEVASPGTRLRDGQIYDINSYTISSLVKSHGGIPRVFDNVEDTEDALAQAVEDARMYDLVVFSGGSSVGERDLLVNVLSSNGRMLFHGIQVKPGKPTLCALVDKKLVFGMPGYPTACLTICYILLSPVLKKLARLPPEKQRTVSGKIAKRFVSTVGRHVILTVKLEVREDEIYAEPVFKESGAITSMSRADGYIEIPPNVDVIEKGENVTVRLF